MGDSVSIGGRGTVRYTGGFRYRDFEVKRDGRFYYAILRRDFAGYRVYSCRFGLPGCGIGGQGESMWGAWFDTHRAAMAYVRGALRGEG